MQPISNKSALAKNVYLCIRYHTNESKIPGISIPIPNPTKTEFLRLAKGFFVITINPMKARQEQLPFYFLQFLQLQSPAPQKSSCLILELHDGQ